MTITLTPETETRLLQQAQHTGTEANSLAETLILDGLNRRAFLGGHKAMNEGVPGAALLPFAGAFEAADLLIMAQTADEDCEQIALQDW